MRRPLCLCTLLLSAALFAWTRLFPPDTPSYEPWNKETVCLSGVVSGKEPLCLPDGETVLELTLQRCTDFSGPGSGAPPLPASSQKVLVRLESDPGLLLHEAESIPVGAHIRIRGTLRCFSPATNPGEFDALRYYQTLRTAFRIDEASVLSVSGKAPAADTLYLIRRSLSSILERCARSPSDAGILRAMLLGERGGIPKEITALYKESGIIHIIAISGLHISLLGMGLFRILAALSKRLTPSRLMSRAPVLPALLSAGFMLLYGQMTGMRSSSLRAVLMFCLHLGAIAAHRSYDLLTSVSLCAALMLLEQPLYLQNSSFLFSFGAVLGIALLMPAFHARPLKALAVPLATLPVHLWFSFTFPVWSLLLNLLVIPLMTFVMLGGIAMLFLGGFSAAAGRIPGLLCHAVLSCYETLCRITAGLPGHRIVCGRPGAWQIALYLLFLLLLLLAENGIPALPQRRATIPRNHFGKPCVRPAPHIPDEEKPGNADCLPQSRNGAAAPGSVRGQIPEFCKFLWILCAVSVLLFRNHSGLRLTVLDVGQGDGIVISADGLHLLIDGGSSSKNSLGRYQLEPFLLSEGIGSLDLAILTHGDSDHCSGLIELLESGYDIRRIGLPELPAAHPEGAEPAGSYQKILTLCAQRHIPVLYLSRGQALRFPASPSLSLSCLHPAAGGSYADANEASLCFLLRYGRFTALLTGDLEGSGEAECLAFLKEAVLPDAAGAPSPVLAGISAAPDPSCPPSGQQEASALRQRLTLLKVGHHGSRGASSAEWLEALQPLYAVISCGRNNRYGHPSPEVLERLREVDCITYETRRSGAICFATDGKSCRIRCFIQ